MSITGDYMDLRVVKTKKNIKNAFLELRKKKPLEKISVKELADLAMINKATFYLHYEDIYALSDEIENEFVDKIISEIHQVNEHSGTYNYSLISKDLISSIYNHKEEEENLFSFGRDWVLLTKIENKLLKLFKESSTTFSDNTELEIVARILIRGTYFVFDDNNYDRDTVIETILKITEQITKLYSDII